MLGSFFQELCPVTASPGSLSIFSFLTQEKCRWTDVCSPCRPSMELPGAMELQLAAAVVGTRLAPWAKLV